MPDIIRLDDPTSHGGRVTQASGVPMFGKPVALKGDLVFCPKEGHGVNPIIEGSSSMSMNGIPVALAGHRTACGCTLLSTLNQVSVAA